MEALGSRWDFLRPWCAPVRGRIAMLDGRRTKLPNSFCAGLDVWLPRSEATPERLRAVGYALVLISMAAQVDRAGWLYVLKAHCDLKPECDDSYTESQEFARAPFMFALDEGTVDRWTEDMLLGFFSEMDAAPSAYFTETVRQVASNVPRRLPALERVDVPIVVTVNATCHGTTLHLERVYRMLCTLKSTHNGWRIPVRISDNMGGHVPIDCGFVLGPMETVLLASWVEPNAIKVFDEMTARGDEVPIGSVTLTAHLDDDAADDATSAQILGAASERLLVASGVPDEKRTMMDHIELHCMLHQPGPITRLCSAMAETRTTRSLHVSFEELEDVEEMDERTWQLLAYALFSGHRHSLATEVSLEYVFMTEEHAAAITAVLGSSDPLTLLFGRQPDTDGDEATTGTSDARRFMLKQGTIVKIQQMHPGETISEDKATWTLSTDVTGVRVISNSIDQDGDQASDPTCCVLLPGYGLCAVQRHKLLEISDDCQTDLHPHNGVTKLSITSMGRAEAAEGLPRFLDAVGSSLTHLRVHSWRGLKMQRLFAACPKLESLSVSSFRRPVISSRSFLAAYRSSDVPLSELKGNFDNLSKIAEELADERTRLARTLRRLKCSPPRGIDDYTEGEHVKAFEKMLAVNQVLQHVTLTMSRDVYNRNVVGLKSHHNEPLAGIGAPLPLSCRLALISAFESTRRSLKRQVKRVAVDFSLDRQVYSIIFAFAADRARRQVYCRLTLTN